MQLGKKSKTTNAFEQIRGELGPETEISAPIAPQAPAASASAAPVAAQSSDRESVHITIAETITAKVSREGTLESLEVKGTVQLRISDAALTQIKLNLAIGDVKGASLMSHPKVDKNLFKNQRVVQTSQGFPRNQALAVVKWTLSPRQATDVQEAPINFNVWVNDAGGNTWNITVEYEWAGGEPLKDVMVSIPYSTSEPAVSSFDAVYEVSGDSIDWTIGSVDEESPIGSFEFEAQASDESEFFPMAVHFTRSKPFIDIDVSSLELFILSSYVNHDTGFFRNVVKRELGHKLLQRRQVFCRELPYCMRSL
jgi:coatomer subunit delta